MYGNINYHILLIVLLCSYLTRILYPGERLIMWGAVPYLIKLDMESFLSILFTK